MLDHARQFITRVLPPPEEGQYINIHWSKVATNDDGTPILKPNGEPVKWWDGRACPSVDEAIKTLQWVIGHGDKDIYTCMSTQSRMEEKTSARGYAYKKALRSSNDVVSLKSLFIDVDVKEGAYEDTREALIALKAFVTSLGIPNPSAVVASGSGGFHAHWALDQALTRDEWQRLADALAKATQELGLKCDTQCTVDSARILRVPDTFNHKSGEPRPVRLLSMGEEVSYDEMLAALQPYIGVLPARPAERIEANDDLGAGVTAKAFPIIIDEVAKHCGFVSRSLGTGGMDNNNPLWFMTASIASFVEDGRDALHKMSDKHKGYEAKATDELYDRAVAKQKEKNYGWPQCSKIAGYGCPECQTCPLLKQNKSPLNFAQVTANQVDKTLPDRFMRNSDGTIAVRAVNDDGTPLTIRLTHYPIMSGWLSPSPWVLHFSTILTDHKTTNFELPAEVIGAKDGLAKYLCSKGFFVGEKESKYLKEFFMAWIQKLQQTKDAVISALPFGWSINNGNIDGFAYGGRVWGTREDRPAASPGGALQYQYTPKGDPQVWHELAHVVYSQNRPGLNAILATAFAGPLVQLTGHHGLLLNAYSTESGIGKTTAMKCAQAVWGHPVLAMAALNDTANSVLGKMGQVKALPFFWDELKSEEQVRNFCNIVFNLTGGREKSRMNTDTSLRDSGTWHTIMVSASNESLIDPMALKYRSTTAGLMRMFEYAVPPPPEKAKDTTPVQRLIGKLEENFGHAGLEYAKFLGANHERVANDLAQLSSDLNHELDIQQEERLWSTTMAVLLAGATFANELKLTQIDVPGLKEFLIKTLHGMRSEVKKTPTDMNDEMALSTILADFINSTRHDTLETNRTWVARGKPPKGTIMVLNDVTKIRRLGVQVSKEDRIMRISSTYFSEWMADHGHSRKVFLDRMEKEYGFELKSGRLGGGTDLTSAFENLIVIDMNHTKLRNLIE